MLYQKYVKMHIKSSMQYRLNTVFLSFSQAVVAVSELLAVYVLFQTFTTVGTWTFYDSLLMFGVVTTVYSFCECFFRGYDSFAEIVQSGELDRLFIRPVNIHYQILGAKLEFSKLGKFFVGVVVSVIAVCKLSITWFIWKVLVLLGMFVCGVVVILSLMILGAGMSIYTIENLEFINIFTCGSKDLAYYPINIYQKWLSRLFTFVIPVACFNYLPLTYLVGGGILPAWVYALSPCFGMLIIIPCVLFFNFSLKKYQGTGT